MMQAGNRGRRERGNGRKSSRKDKVQLSVCDLSSDEFKKTWLTLKELHDKELHRLQTKLTSMRKSHTAEGRRSASTARIRELTEQHDILNSTIHDLRDQLNAKTCDRCLINEAYRNTLQQEFNNMQQQNLRFIAELNAETKKLREENRRLSATVKSSQPKFHISFSDSDDDDFIPCTQKTKPVFSVREPTQLTQVHVPVRPVKKPHKELMKSISKMELERSPQLPIPFGSQDLFEVPETSFEKTPSSDGKPTTQGGTAYLNSFSGFPLTSSFDSNKRSGFQSAISLSEKKVGHPKWKHETSIIEKHESKIRFSWSLSSVSSRESAPTQIVSETSEENMPGYDRSLRAPFTQKRETLPLNVFPFDYTSKSSGRKRSAFGIPCYNNGFSGRDGSTWMPSCEQTARKNANESTCAWSGTVKSQADSDSALLGPTLKRKARIQLEKKK